MAASHDDVRAAVARIRWYHRIDLGNGIVTPGESDNAKILKRLRLPENLAGQTVLDIGAWDGFFSFEVERRGARRVLATDWFCWGGPGWGTKDGFELARSVLHSQVEDREVDVLDLSPESVGVFDTVLFLGVLYHMRHPVLALERVASVTRRLLILETHVDMLQVMRPACAFYPNDELDRDGTNWFGPNPRAVEGMLRTVGFQRIEVVWKPRPLPVRLATGALRAARRQRRFAAAINQSRMVVHAWK